MATCTSPLAIELSSDTEDGVNYDSSQTAPYTSQSSDDVFTLDWADDNPPGGFDILDLDCEPPNVDDGNHSISSAETVIYSPPRIVDESLEVPSNSQIPSQTDRKQVEKEIREQQKKERQRLREERKAEVLKEKRIKAAQAQRQKLLKPEENIKLLRINIDTKIVTSEMGGIVITSLQQAGLQYDVGNHIKANTVSWSKRVTDVLVNDEGIVHESAGDRDENQLLYLIDFRMLIGLVKSKELLVHVETIKSVFMDKLLTVVIVGMQKYFSSLRKKRSKDSDDGKGKGRKTGADDITITQDELDYALIELQLIGRTNHWFVETGEELASLIITTTKSLSQIDYKREKHKREECELDWFAKADAKQCVKVDKDGNGLLSLWQQQICQFNAVGIEMASAIASNYNSPQELIRSYEKCSSRSEAELLLQNIQMRRNAGILSSTRRIGPEASRKLYHFYTSDDPDFEL